MDINSNSIFTTEKVRNLFGPNISPIIFTSKCSHQRSSGMLYIASNCLCFYSNIFGFEQKLMIQIGDITFAGLTRSTSIIIRSKCIGSAGGSKMGNDAYDDSSIITGNIVNSDHLKKINYDDSEIYLEEEHVFKSFQEREYVLRIILNLIEKKNDSLKNQNNIATTTKYKHSTSIMNIKADANNRYHYHDSSIVRRRISSENNIPTNDICINPSANIINDLPVVPTILHRQRTHSDPVNNKKYNNITSKNIDNSKIYTPTNVQQSISTANWIRRKILSSNTLQSMSVHTEHNSKYNDQETQRDDISLKQNLDPIVNTNHIKAIPSLLIDDIKSSFEKSFPEVIVKSHHIPMYSLDQFFITFLGNDATKSLYDFQKGVFNSRNIEISNWVAFFSNDKNNHHDATKGDNDDNGLHLSLVGLQEQCNQHGISCIHQSRSISLIHPRNAKIGPATAQITRMQYCTTISSSTSTASPMAPKLMILDTITKLYGIPYSDCFHVEEKWILETTESNNLHLSIRFNIKFVKSTMMKKIIIKQTTQEVKYWYQMYLQYISSDQNEKNMISTMIAEEDTNICYVTDKGVFVDWLTPIHLSVVICIILFAHLAWGIQVLNRKLSMMEGLINHLIEKEESCEGHEIHVMKNIV